MPKPSFETLAATPSMTRESAPTATPVGAVESSSNELRPEDALYEAESPDEAALVNCAKVIEAFILRFNLFYSQGYGVSLMKRELSRVLVQWPNVGHLTEYRIRATLPFDSTRKMMSVIVQEEIKNDQNGGKEDRFILLTKGADSAVFGRLRSDQNFEQASADSHVADYATAGLRTLAFGRKLMSEEEVEKAKAAIHKAEKDLDDSDALLQEVYATIETELELLGVTAIEDRLQEGVPETIRDLRRAGLAVWILTGDKLQTALEIGKLANLIKPKDSLFTVDCETKDELIQKMRSMLSFFTEELPRAEMKSSSINPFGSCRKKSIDAPRKPNTIMIITGKNLKWAFDGEHEKKSDAYENFLKIASACEAVICCRVTPLQKRQVVEKIAKFTKVRTLAIGDGANDVSMIQV
jgi:magnesium-transporting ATPase (P-type)